MLNRHVEIDSRCNTSGSDSKCEDRQVEQPSPDGGVPPLQHEVEERGKDEC